MSSSLADVEKNRKPTRPFIFDRDSGQMVRISPEFETFLIKAPAELKTMLATHMETTKAGNIGNQLIRSKVLSKFAKAKMVRYSDIVTKNTEKMGKVSSLVSSVSAVGAGDVATNSEEKQKLLQDLQEGSLADSQIVRDAQFHLMWIEYMLKTEDSAPNTSTVQRMRSWSNPLFAYSEGN